MELLLLGDLRTGKAILRDYINGAIGFEKLGKMTGMPTKSLMRMFGPNPTRRHPSCAVTLPTA